MIPVAFVNMFHLNFTNLSYMHMCISNNDITENLVKFYSIQFSVMSLFTISVHLSRGQWSSSTSQTVYFMVHTRQQKSVVHHSFDNYVLIYLKSRKSELTKLNHI